MDWGSFAAIGAVVVVALVAIGCCIDSLRERIKDSQDNLKSRRGGG